MPSFLNNLLIQPKKHSPQGHRYLENIIRNNTPPIFQSQQVNIIYNNICHIFKQNFGNKIFEFIKSGSRAKGTAIIGSSDIDLVVVFKADSFYSIEEMYDATEAFLKQYGPVRRQNVSFGIKIGDWEVDITPAKKQKNFTTTLSIRNNKKNSYIETNVKQHIKYVQDSGCKNEIKVMKIWNRQNQLEIESFLIEIAVIQALRRKILYSFQKRIEIVLDFFASDLLQQQIIDPAKPSNILNADIDGLQKLKIIVATYVPRTSKTWDDFIK